jgi:hypothetical protein
MKSIFRTVAAAAFLAMAVSFASPASAAEGCAATIIRARAAEIPGMKIDRFETVDSGLLMTVARHGTEGIVMVGMTVVGLDLVTFQSVYGRDGVSAVSPEESKWLNDLFAKLYPDAAFRACPEVARPEKPTSEAVFASMQTWWKEQNEKDEKYSADNRWIVILVAAAAVVLILGLSTAIVVRRRRKKPAAQSADARTGTSEESPEVQPQAPAAPESSVDEGGATTTEDPEEVL